MRLNMAVSEGSIPACAGEPTFKAVCTVCSAVYPRVCGGTRRPAAAAAKGLSPRVRGNLKRSWGPAVWLRSIPACAGEPRPYAGNLNAYEVYPRVCGGTPNAIAV